MTEPTHILVDILEKYARQQPEKNMLHARIDGQWIGQTAPEIRELAKQMAASLLRLGVDSTHRDDEHRAKVAIIANNRPEWMIADFAIQYAGAVSVPLYPSITASEWEYILNESKTSVLVISDKIIWRKVKLIKDNVPSLRYIFSFDETEGVMHWSELLKPYTEEEAARIETITQQTQPDHLATLIYTSGTTGNPKGVMLSQRNIMSNVLDSMEAFWFCNANENTLSFLPLNHIFERTVMYIYLNKQVSVYFAEGMETIGRDLQEVKPVVFTTVPRLLEKVFEKIEAKGNSLQGIKRKIFDWSVKLAQHYEVGRWHSPGYRLQLAIADKLVYRKWREAVGGKIQAIVTGSAACQVKLLRIFTAAKIIVMEGYGLTETSPVVSVNRFEEKNRRFGTVGTLIAHVEVKLADDGEILCKGPNIMMGYYRHPEMTAEVIQDGWFHTGDIGTWVDGRFLKITDRKKEIFKISGGKYVAPLPLENKMKESPFIEQLMIVGSNEKFVGALIVPSLSAIRDHLGLNNESIQDKTTFLLQKEVQRLIRNELDIYNREFAAHEQVKKFQLLANEWTIEGGELTATMKLRRKIIAEKYADAIEKIYA